MTYNIQHIYCAIFVCLLTEASEENSVCSQLSQQYEYGLIFLLKTLFCY